MKKDKIRFTYEKIKILTGCSLLAAGAILTLLAGNVGGFAQWYSTHVYPVWVNMLGRMMGVFPVSVAEILLYLLGALLLFTLGRLLWKLFRKRTGKRQVLGWFSNLLLAAGVLFLLYVVNCGINYHRTSFSESSGIKAEEYSVSELKEVCGWLTERVNTLSGSVTRDDEGIMRLTGGNKGEVRSRAVEAMQSLGETYPELSGYYPEPKGLLAPWILSVQQLSGIYSPFTIEANYNSGMVDYNIPFTACHELSHLKSFMQEQEANFIAFLASTSYEDPEFQYSGYLLGWIYCMNVLHDADYDSWQEIRDTLSDGAEMDLRENNAFWARYDGAVAEVADQVNDRYLQANGQEEGVKSYDRMVDLIVSWYRMGMAENR
nr:DUF3810 domain-containing protein [uncultured Merdimonas sp.]